MPNPCRSSVCDCTCVLTRIDHCLVNNSIMMFARVGTKPGLWTLDWTMDWIMDSILDSVGH